MCVRADKSPISSSLLFFCSYKHLKPFFPNLFHFPLLLSSLPPSLPPSLGLSPDWGVLLEQEGRHLAEVDALGRRDGLLDQVPLVVLRRVRKGGREGGREEGWGEDEQTQMKNERI